MPDEMFYFYHVAHMAKHFEYGGCGIRTLIDLWILDGISSNNRENRDGLLEKGGLLKFADTVRALCKVWFAREVHTDITRCAEEFIIAGGIYGTSDARILIQQQKKGGKLGFALSKIFLPYDALKLVYPVLQKHKWLTSVMQVRRWLRLIFCGHFKRSMHELASNASISKKEADETREFLKNIGL